MIEIFLTAILCCKVVEGVVPYSPNAPDQDFYVVTNQPSRGRNRNDIYLYAIHTESITSGDEVEFSREVGLKSDIVESGEIRALGAIWGCYLRVGRPKRYKGSRFGTYEATYIPADGSPSMTRHTFVKPETKLLNTMGVYTVTMYPTAEGSTELAPSDDNPIGVSWTPGCQNIRWCKGKRRNINTGPRLTLTSTTDAGIYTIQRWQRGQRGWLAQIEVIVATCPMHQYWNGANCVSRMNFPCVNGGAPKDAADECLCPPYYTSPTCNTRVNVVPDIFLLGFNLGSSLSKLFCEDLPGGNNNCRGLLFCPGDLFGCKCFPGWYGNNCDRACPKGKWGVNCALRCSDVNNCNRFVNVFP